MKPRINLSLATINDIEYIVNIKTNPSLWPYEDDISLDKEKMRNTVIERLNGDWYKQYIIRLNNNEKTIIGEIRIHWYVKERKSWEMGYCITPEYRGRGYSSEAAGEVLKYAFKEWGAHKVVAMCNRNNIASYHIMEKIGMTKEGVFREELPVNGEWVDQLFYSILDSEYNDCSTVRS